MKKLLLGLVALGIASTAYAGVKKIGRDLDELKELSVDELSDDFVVHFH